MFPANVQLADLLPSFQDKFTVSAAAVGGQIVGADPTRWAIIFFNQSASAGVMVCPHNKAASANLGFVMNAWATMAIPWSLYPTLPGASWFLVNAGAGNLNVYELFYRPSPQAYTNADLATLPNSFGNPGMQPSDMGTGLGLG